jgi:hypothetical protein
MSVRNIANSQQLGIVARDALKPSKANSEEGSSNVNFPGSPAIGGLLHAAPISSVRWLSWGARSALGPDRWYASH